MKNRSPRFWIAQTATRWGVLIGFAVLPFVSCVHPVSVGIGTDIRFQDESLTGEPMGSQYHACPSCDGPVKKGSKFCSTCGAEFEVEDSEASRENWLRTKLIEFGVIADETADGGDGGDGDEGEANDNGEPAKRTFEVYD